MTPADIIRSHKLGDDFDINGVTYRIVVLNGLGDWRHCGMCPMGNYDRCLRESNAFCRPCRPPPAPHSGSRFVVPVSEVPVLAVKGILA